MMSVLLLSAASDGLVSERANMSHSRHFLSGFMSSLIPNTERIICQHQLCCHITKSHPKYSVLVSNTSGDVLLSHHNIGFFCHTEGLKCPDVSWSCDHGSVWRCCVVSQRLIRCVCSLRSQKPLKHSQCLFQNIQF